MIKYFLIFSLLLISCNKENVDSEKTKKYQKIVDAFNTINIPPLDDDFIDADDLTIKPSNAFDVNSYFNVLRNIKMKKGYVLDYVLYHSWPDGFTKLFAHAENDNRIKTYRDLRKEMHQVFKLNNDYYHFDDNIHPYNYENFIN